jgi:hypothetical protein
MSGDVLMGGSARVNCVYGVFDLRYPQVCLRLNTCVLANKEQKEQKLASLPQCCTAAVELWP